MMKLVFFLFFCADPRSRGALTERREGIKCRGILFILFALPNKLFKLLGAVNCVLIVSDSLVEMFWCLNAVGYVRASQPGGDHLSGVTPGAAAY